MASACFLKGESVLMSDFTCAYSTLSPSGVRDEHKLHHTSYLVSYSTSPTAPPSTPIANLVISTFYWETLGVEVILR